MKRRHWIFVALALSGCTRNLPAPVFSPVVAGVWKLKASRTLAADSAPELVRKMGMRGAWSATYEGPGSVTVELYELAAPGVGLEIMQNWRPVPDTVVWYTPHYFVVARWQSADREAVKALVRSIQKQFAEPKWSARSPLDGPKVTNDHAKSESP
jgi:hypothetical protein